jgi:choice-of-anchor C domain-containing protein
MKARFWSAAFLLAGAAPSLLAQSAGNFENPNLALGSGIYYADALIWYRTYSAGSGVGGWAVDQGSVDLIRHTTGTSLLGEQSVDMNGVSPGSLSRTFATIAGQQYRLGFDFSGNPIGLGVRVLDVKVDQMPVAQFIWNPAIEQNNFHNNMKWSQREVTFTAAGPNTRVQLVSANAGLSGPMIDNITFNPVIPADVNTISRFESPVLSTGGGTFYAEAQLWYRTYSVGADFDGWTLVEGSADLLNHKAGTARAGAQTVDLNGISAGTLRRTFSTVIGTRYRLEFDFSGNPIDGKVRTMAVRVNGAEQNRFDWDPKVKNNHFTTDLKWERRFVEFVATTSSTVLELASVLPGQSGPLVDNVAFFVAENPEVEIVPAVILTWPIPSWGTEGTILEGAASATGPWAAVTPTLQSVAADGKVTLAVPATLETRFFRIRSGAN